MDGLESLMLPSHKQVPNKHETVWNIQTVTYGSFIECSYSYFQGMSGEEAIAKYLRDVEKDPTISGRPVEYSVSDKAGVSPKGSSQTVVYKRDKDNNLVMSARPQQNGGISASNGDPSKTSATKEKVRPARPPPPTPASPHYAVPKSYSAVGTESQPISPQGAKKSGVRFGSVKSLKSLGSKSPESKTDAKQGSSLWYSGFADEGNYAWGNGAVSVNKPSLTGK